MPAYLSVLRKQTRKMVVKLPGEMGEIAVTYRPGVLTPAYEEYLGKGDPEKAETFGDRLVNCVMDLVAGWDFKAEESDKKPLELSREVLRTLPHDVLLALASEPAGDMGPNETRTEASDDI